MDTSQLPSLTDLALGNARPGAPAAPDQSNAVVAGLKSGTYGALSSFAGAVAAGAKLAGYDTGAANAEARAQGYAQSAQDSGRADLEAQGFTGGGLGGALKYAAYRGAQFVPQVAGMVAGTALAAEALPEIGTAGTLARLGAMAPKFVGGAGGAVTEEGLAQGAKLAGGVLAGGLGGMAPTAVGDIYNADAQRGAPTRGQAAMAFALGIPVGLVQAVGPHGTTGPLANIGAHAAAFALGSGIQKGAEDAGDPNLTLGQRASNVISSAAEGAVMGGMFGASGSAFKALGARLKGPPENTSNADLSAAVDQIVQPEVQGPPEMQGPPDPAAAQMSFDVTQPQMQGPQEPFGPRAPSQAGPLFDYMPDRFGPTVVGVGEDMQRAAQRAGASIQGMRGMRPIGELPPDLMSEPNAQQTLDLRQPAPPPEVQGPADLYGPRPPSDVGPLFDPRSNTDPVQGQTLADLTARMAEAGQRSRDRVAALRSQVIEPEGIQLSPEIEAQLGRLGGTAPALEDVARREPEIAAQQAAKPAVETPEKQTVFQQFGSDSVGPRGVMRDWITSSSAKTEAELYNQMADELAAKSKVSRTAGFKTMAQQIGLLDDDKKPLDLAKARAEANDIPNEQARTSELRSLDAIEQRRAAADALRTPVEGRDVGTPSVDEPKRAISSESMAAAPDSIAELAARARDGLPADQIDDPRASKTGTVMSSKALRPKTGRNDSKIGPILQSLVHSGARPDEALPQPKSIADRVVDAAHELTGGTGGEARIADIRKALPDVASADIDNALRQIHGDDSDSTLTQAPKGQRAGVDGVALQGQGKFHNLSVEPRDQVAADADLVDQHGTRLQGNEYTRLDQVRAATGLSQQRFNDAVIRLRNERRANVQNLDNPRHINEVKDGGGEVTDGAQTYHAGYFGPRYNEGVKGALEEPSATRVGAGEQPAAVPADRAGDQPVRDAAGAQPNQERGEVAPQAAQGDRADLKPIGKREAYPGTQAAAERLGIRMPDLDRMRQIEPSAATAFEQRVPLLWNMAQKGQFGRDYGSLWRETDEYFRRTNDVTAQPRDPVTPTGEPIDMRSSSEKMMAEARARIAAQRAAPVQVAVETAKAVAEVSKPEPLRTRQVKFSVQTEAGRRANAAAKIMEMRKAKALEKPITTVEANGATSMDADTIGASTLETIAKALAEKPEDLQAAPPAAPHAELPPQARAGGIVEAYQREKYNRMLAAVTAKLTPEMRDRITVLHPGEAEPAAVQNVRRYPGFEGFAKDVPGSREVEAFHQGGHVYIDPRRVTTPERLQAVISHEVYGHLGNYLREGGDDVKQADHIASTARIFDQVGNADTFKSILNTYGVKNAAHEFASYPGIQKFLRGETLSNSEKYGVVEEMFSKAAENQGGLTDARRATLAFLGRVKRAIAEGFRKVGLNDAAAKFERFGVADVERYLADNRSILEGTPPEGKVDLTTIPSWKMQSLMRDEKAYLTPQASAPAPGGTRSVRDMLEGTTAVMKYVGPLQNQLSKAGPTLRKLGIGLMTRQDIERFYDKDFGGTEAKAGMLRQDGHLAELKTNISTATNQYHIQTARDLGNLRRSDLRGAYKDYVSVKNRASLLGYDPTKSLKENTHLDPTAKNYAEIVASHAEDNRTWNKWGQQGKGLQDLYRRHDMAMKADQFFAHTGSLHLMVDSLLGGKVEGFEHNVLDDLPSSTLIRDPQSAYTFARAEYQKRIDALDQHLVTADPLSPQTDAVRSAVKNMKGAVERMDQSPYTHFGREGNYMVAFKLRAADDDAVTAHPDAVAALEKATADLGMPDLHFNTYGTNRDVFVKVQSPHQMEMLDKAVRGMPEHLDPEANVRSGLIQSRFLENDANVAPYIKEVIAAADAKLKDSPTKEASLNMLRGILMDMIPESSALKLQSQRAGVQGFSSDSLKNDLFRQRVASNALGHIAVLSRRNEVQAKISQAMQDATLKGGADAIRIQQAGQGHLERNAAQSSRVEYSVADQLKGYAHSFYLGMSPAYMIMNLMQPTMLTFPELAKSHGFGQAALHMAGAYKDMSRVMRAMVSVQGDAWNAWRRGETTDITAGVTPAVIEKAKALGISQNTADLLAKLSAAGKLESGTFAHSTFSGLDTRGWGGSFLGNVGSKTLRMVNTTATMAELQARLIAGLAAGRAFDANPGKARGFESAHDYAGHVIAESMFEWGGDQTSKLFSRAGPLGEYTPVATQFHGYSTRLAFKLLSEVHDAMLATGVEKAEARRFVAGHAAAVMLMSGVMGLPLAGWMAGAVTSGSTLLNPGGEAYDVNLHFNHFMEDTFGKSLGQALTHGLPRFVNTDMSDLGDRDLLPMQSLLEDRRKFSDAIGDYLSKAWGSSVGAGTNIFQAGLDLRDGRTMAAAMHMMPTALKNVAKAYQIGEHGYVDGRGNPMPIKPDAFSILKTVLGVQEGSVADAREKQSEFAGLQADRKYHSGLIKEGIWRAQQSGDQDAYASWWNEAAKYDADPSHRANLISPTIPGFIQQQTQRAAISQAMGLPRGMKPVDPMAELFQ